jgi:hypothetical protein
MLAVLAFVTLTGCSRAPRVDQSGLALLQLRSAPQAERSTCDDELHKAVHFDIGMEDLDAVNADRGTYDRVMASLSDGMNLQTFLLFFGYPRSGHSLVASLLDAHPDAAVANEFDAIKAYRKGETRENLLRKLVSISTAYKMVGRCQAGYHYVVPGVAARPFGPGRKLRVIGDKLAGVTSRKQLTRAELLDFQHYVGLTVSLVHVVRNPFDMVASRFAAGTAELLGRWALQHNASHHPYLAENPTKVEGNEGLLASLDYSVDLVITEMTYNMKVRKWIARGELPAYRWIDVLHDDFVHSPTSQLELLCEFLGLDCRQDEYLSRAASIVRDEVRAEYPDGAHLWTPRAPRHIGSFKPLG